MSVRSSPPGRPVTPSFLDRLLRPETAALAESTCAAGQRQPVSPGQMGPLGRHQNLLLHAAARYADTPVLADSRPHAREPSTQAEAGPTREILAAPQHAYTHQLLANAPSLTTARPRTPVSAPKADTVPLVEVRNLMKECRLPPRWGESAHQEARVEAV